MALTPISLKVKSYEKVVQAELAKEGSHDFSDRDIEEVCRVIYDGDTYHQGTWKTMKKLSPSLYIITRRQAIRVLRWHQERVDAGGLL